MGPTLEALLPLLASHPTHARLLYEVGGAYDTAGEESTARNYYERALDAGLDGDLLRRCFLQYGSTLRNLGEIERSLAILASARTAFPGSASVRAFEAITLQAAGRPDEAIAGLLELLADIGAEPSVASDVQRYDAALRGNAAWIRSHAHKV